MKIQEIEMIKPPLYDHPLDDHTVEGPSRMTSSLFLKLWQAPTFKDWRISLYIVANSESNEGLVMFQQIRGNEELI